MSILAKHRIAQVWSKIAAPLTLRTPSGSDVFTVVSRTPTELSVAFEGGGNQLVIARSSFEAAIDYLNQHEHGVGHPCRIEAHNSPAQAGPLCLASRKKTDGSYGPRSITYILPILAEVGVVEIDGRVPTTTWLV